MSSREPMTIKISINNNITDNPNITVSIEIDSEVVHEVHELPEPIILDYSCVG